MATKTEAAQMTPLVQEAITSFSDYQSGMATILERNVDSIVVHITKRYDVLVKVRKAIAAEGGDAKPGAKAIGTWLRKGGKWTTKDETIADVLWWGERHTAGRFATFTKLTLDDKPEWTMNIGQYRSFLSDIEGKRRDEDGKLTPYGTKVTTWTDKRKAAKATVKPSADMTVVTTDFRQDLKGKDNKPLPLATQLKALLLTQQALMADIAAVERELHAGTTKAKGDAAVKAVRDSVSALVTSAAKAVHTAARPTRPTD
jgi:hypothetical protein